MSRSIVSTQDLLSDSQRSGYSNDSVLFSLSEKQLHSQSNFSQVRTQDLFTQNPSTSQGGTQSESSFPPTRKINIYDKWMSKRPQFRKDETIAGNAPVLRGQQNTASRAKDADDRDLLQQVVNIVQDCTKEVRNTLIAVKEKLESQSGFMEENCKSADTLKAFLEDLWRHEQRMLQALEEGKRSEDKLLQMEKQLAAKEVVIQQLQQQLEERDRPGNVKQLARAVRQEMLSPQLAMENKLMEILEVVQEMSEQQSHYFSLYESQVTSQAKDYNMWKTNNQKLLKDLEKRLQKEIESLRKELQKTETNWTRNIQAQLIQARSVHTQDLEVVVERTVSQCTSALKQQRAGSGAATSTMVSAMKKELQTLLQKHTKATEKTLQAAWQEQTKTQQQQLQSLNHTLMGVISQGLESLAKDSSNEDQLVPLTVPAFEEKIEEYQADIKKQLEDMHRHYVDEVKQLQVEASGPILPDPPLRSSTKPLLSDRVTVTAAQSGAATPSSAHDYFIPAASYNQQPRSGMARISPLYRQNRGNLFFKSKPSPIAAVIPQKKLASSAQTEVLPDTSNSDIVLCDVTAEKQTELPNEGTTSKKRKIVRGKKKQSGNKVSGRKPLRQHHVTDTDSGKTTIAGKVTTTGKVTASGMATNSGKVTASANAKNSGKVTASKVYDFSDEHSPDRCSRPLLRLKYPSNWNQKNKRCSPSASTESCLSSPAMSIAVDTTEMIWVHSSRWRTLSPFPDNYCSGEKVRDMLSSPFLSSSASQHAVLEHSQKEETQPELPRTRSYAKRHL